MSESENRITRKMAVDMVMESMALYTRPNQWQGLSGDEIDKLYADWECGQTDYSNYARAIEQALKEKNT